MEQTNLSTIRSALEHERDVLKRQLADYGAAPGGAGIDVSMDEGFADSAQVTAERSELLSMIEQLRGAYDEIAAAVSRIDEGTYGKCERCGQQIPVERLEALPTARLCLDCKQAGRKT